MKKTLLCSITTFFMLLLSYTAYSQLSIEVQHVGQPIVIDGDFWE